MDDAATGSMRIDKFLWFARLAGSRKLAQAMAEAGMIRLDGRRVERAHLAVRTGAVLALVQGGRVRVLRIDRLPLRRGSAAEAAMLVSELGEPDTRPVDKPVDGAGARA